MVRAQLGLPRAAFARNWGRALVLITLFSGIIAGQGTTDSAVVLAQILADKGQITASDLARIRQAAESERVQILACILRTKGVLDNADLAKLSLPAAPSSAASSNILARGPSSANPPTAAPTTVAASSPNAISAPEAATVKKPVEVNGGKSVPLTLYGTLLFNTGLSTAGVNLSDAGTIASKPGSSAIAGTQSFFGTARQTRFGVRLNPTEIAGAALTGDLEVDAYSSGAPFSNGINMGLFRLRLAYGRLDWKNFAIEAGQDWAIFAPLNPSSLAMYAVPEFSGSGNPWGRAPQIRMEAKGSINENNRILYQLSAGDPDVGDYPSTFVGTRPPGAGELGRMPAIESRLAWSATDDGRDFTLGVSGHYGRGRNIGTLNGLTVKQPVDSWGVALDYSLPFTKAFNFSGEAYEGRALGIYNVAAGESVGALGTPGGHGVLSRGGWVQTQFNLNRQWQLNAGYGIDNPSARDVPVGSRNRNQNVFGNFIYKLSPTVNISLEYRRLLSYFRNQAFDTGRANQVVLSGAYIF